MGEHLLLWVMYYKVRNIIYVTIDYVGYQSKHKNHCNALQ